MADLPESNDWTPGLYQLETSDPVLGGPEGISNLQAKQLGSRTRWLKKKVEALVEKVEQATESVMGLARIATPSLVRNGIDDRTIVTPKKLAGMFPFRGRIIYSTPGIYTWTVPSGVTSAWVVVIGAGGGGARLTSLPGPSGGSGGGIAKKLVDLTGIKSVTISVGAGGIGALTDGDTGTNGATSSFGTTLWASGGWGGFINGKAPSGGMGVGGDENGCIGLASHAIGGPDKGFLGGAGGGGESGPTWVDVNKPKLPGQGGGGRGGSAAPDGADGRVTIQW